MARKKPIISPLGQWAYPGEVTIIPSSDITMKGVNYPVLGIDDLGNQQMMMPGQDYTFPGDYVTEIPQMGKGGLRQWFDEKWVDVKTGKACGRSGKDKNSRPYPACRPSKRVNETTPKTTSEMSSSEKAKFKREKTSGKRIDYNHKRRQDGGEWLDDEPEVNPKIGWNSGNRYSYDKKGNLIYTNHPLSFDYDVEQFIEHAINDKSGWLGNSLNDYEIDFLKNAKNKIQNLDVWPRSLEFQVKTKVDKLNPSLDELINVTQNIYPDQYAIDNSFSKASKSRIDLPASAFENDIKERYVIPEILKNSINKRFGTLPTTRDDSYSPNRIWTTKVKNDEDSNVGARFAIDEDNSKYAYILTPNSKKTSDLSKEKINTKKENIENLLSSADNKFYENLYLKYPDYIQYPGNYNNPEISLFGDIKNILPNQMWNRAEQMRVEMLNNPEIKDWADLHNVNLSRGNEDSKQNLVIDSFAPKVPESAYANRLVKAGLPVSTPDYSYGADDTYIVQDPSKFNLAGYFPIPKDYDEENAKQLIAKKLGIKPEQLNNKDYLIHYNKSPITEYTPGKKYGGWLDQFQTGGIRRPIYTSNPRDPRIGSYRDSLNLYNSGEDYYSRLKKSSFDSPNIGVSEEDLKKARDENYKKYPWDKLKMPVSNEKSGKKFQPVSKYNIYVSDVGNIESNRYKKPVQPYIYKKPEVSPIYTSDINDPRLASYNDSLYLYKSAKNDFNKFNKLSNNFDRDLNDEEWQRNSDRYDKLLNLQKNKWHTADRPNYTANYPYKGPKSGLTIQPVGLEGFYREGYHFPRFKKPVQPYIYKPEVVPEVTETPLTPTPVVEPPKPSLFVSNIDRDMYTPGGGMAREYNIGVTLQDGNRKLFRTEKEFQDWKAANNLDISKAKVTEGRGYSYDYPENKKYGGWLNKYQPGGYVKYVPPSKRPLTLQSSNPSTTDNTRLVTQNTNVSAANRKAAEAAEYAKRVGSVSQGKTKSAYEKAREASSFVSQAQQRKGSADPLDYVLDMVNPATYGFAGADLIGNTAMGVNNLAKGNFSDAAGNAFDAGLNALYLLPAKGIAKAIASPMAFRPVEGMMYRGLGKEGFKDAVQSGVFRPKQLNYAPGRSFAERVNSPKQFGSTYYAPSKKFGVIENYGPEYVAEVPYNEADFFRRYSKRNDWSYSTPRQIPITEGKILKKDWLLGYKPVDVSNIQQSVPSSVNPALSGFVPDITNTRLYKGVFQKYPKGPLTQEEITAFKNSPEYLKRTKEHLDLVKQYGDDWKLPNYMDDTLQEAIATGNRSRINPTLYGGKNWNKLDYFQAGVLGLGYPAATSIYGLAFSPPAVKNRVLKNVGVQGPAGGLSFRDTTIDITNSLMDFAKVNEVKDGNIIIGGEFIEDANNTVRKAKDWLSATDTYSDKQYPSKDIQSFYGVENGKFKVGKANQFNPDTEIVPRRFGEANISKAVLNGKEMRLLDNEGNPIYQNTPNTGKFILYSPSTGKSQFTYINDGKAGVTKVNDFLKKNKDAQYIHLDNGRYEYYGLNPEGLNEQDYQNYYEQDLKREGNPGYNLIIKGKGGQTNWLDIYQDAGEVPSDIERMQGAEIFKKRSWLDKLRGYVHKGEKAIGLDPYNERSDDFMEQWARRINTATGGKDWYKQPNDASGAGGIGTAMMETVMAPFSAPQLASVYGATGKVQMPSEAMNIQNPVGAFLTDAVLDPTNLVGAGIAKNLGKGSLQNMVRSRMSGIRPSIQNSVDNIATPNISQSASISPVSWQAQELPGLHLKSTMTDGPISKIVEPKTGLVNVEQALGIIGKESGGVDKVALIKQSLGENIPKKMDYNDFRKTVQDQLIPLEKQFSTERSDYGIDRLGYAPGKFVTKEVDGKKIHTYESDYLDNQTILFSNKDKFGRGSGAHSNPDETLGHAHYLIDKGSPDVLTVTQIQSDAFQGRYRIPIGIDNEIKELKNKLKYYDSEEVKNRTETAGNISRINHEIKKLEEKQVSKFNDNVVQKSLLDKNHQERYLQELVDYAGKQDYLNKVRVPTAETAAKVQNYRPVSQAIVGDVDLELAALSNNSITNIDDLSTATLRTITQDFDIRLSKINNSGLPERRDLKDIISDLETKGAFKKLSDKTDFISLFDTNHQTILKKYAEQPKTIKKLFGEEPKIVTDSKGNTWYEFDIPKKFKEGKGEIKAFSTIGGIGVAGAAASQLQEQKKGGQTSWLNKYK